MYIPDSTGGLKRVLQDDIPVTSQAKQGLQVLRELKNKPHRVFKAGPVFTDQEILISTRPERVAVSKIKSFKSLPQQVR